jgi:hypothetical protein
MAGAGEAHGRAGSSATSVSKASGRAGKAAADGGETRCWAAAARPVAATQGSGKAATPGCSAMTGRGSLSPWTRRAQ